MILNQKIEPWICKAHSGEQRYLIAVSQAHLPHHTHQTSPAEARAMGGPGSGGAGRDTICQKP